MTSARAIAAAEAATSLILEVFRLNGQLLAAADRLVSGLDLTSARWAVLGAIANSDSAKPVAWLARDLGMHRQGVQRITNDLLKNGFVELAPNPHHRRASLVELTARGREAYKAAMRAYKPWVESLAKGFSLGDLETAQRVAAALRDRLQVLERRRPFATPPQKDRGLARSGRRPMRAGRLRR